MTTATDYMTRRSEIGEDAILEALIRVRDRLEAIRGRPTGDPRWAFGDWLTCTCGHIYAETMKGRTDFPHTARIEIENPELIDGLYEETLKEVAIALGLRPNEINSGLALAAAVSDATIAASNRLTGEAPCNRTVRVEAGLDVINSAIHKIVARQRERMERVAREGKAER